MPAKKLMKPAWKQVGPARGISLEQPWTFGEGVFGVLIT